MHYYVYNWVNPKTTEVFYVGKGKYAKCYDRAYNKHHAGRCQKKREKLHSEGYSDVDIVHIIKEFNTELEALSYETEQINTYGIIEEGGTLFNFRKNGTEAGSYQKYRDRDIKDIIKAYESGMTMLKIGEMYNVHETTIRKYLKESNAIIRRQGKDLKNPPPNFNDAYEKVLRGELRRCDLKKELNTNTYQNILRWIKIYESSISALPS
jgi:hypothetical protein